MRRNWQPINPSIFAPNFAIFQPNLHLTAHSFLSAAGRLCMLANCGLDQGWNLFNCSNNFVGVHLFKRELLDSLFVQKFSCSIVHC